MWWLPAVTERGKKIVDEERGLRSLRQRQQSPFVKDHMLAVFKPQGSNSGLRWL